MFEISTKTSIADVEIVENNTEDLIFWICSDFVSSITTTFGSDCSSSSSSFCSSISSVLDLMTVKNISVIPSITSVVIDESIEYTGGTLLTALSISEFVAFSSTTIKYLGAEKVVGDSCPTSNLIT